MRSPSISQLRKSKDFCDYAASVRKMALEFLGWSDARTDAYLEECLACPAFRTVYLHDGPCRNMAALIVRESMDGCVSGVALVRLHQRLRRAMFSHCQTGHYLHKDRSYDWKAARARVTNVLKSYDKVVG